ncbi:MAG: MaoC family dehydratase [Proteobacteria bacterium]|nr:MaoC family dehydratase [Pseudomonadota bacterium]
MTSKFNHPDEDRYFEDYQKGAVYEFGPIKMEKSRIIDFAKEFDPQPIHVDEEFATNGQYKGLISSGWHTGSVMMRLYADNYLSPVSSLGSPGVDELRWLLPVRPGDMLSTRISILEAKLSKSKPDRGVVTSFIEVLNQNNEIVMTMTAANFVLCQK